MHDTKRIRTRGLSAPGFALTLALMLLVLALGIAGCAPGQNAAQPAAQSPSATPQSSTPTAGAPVTGTAVAPITGTATITATGTPIPTPTGPAPDPMSQLQLLAFINSEDDLVKRDLLDLNGDGKLHEVLFTISGNRVPITAEVTSRVAVLTYDDVYRTWSLPWYSAPITGTAHPLPAANRSGAGGYNGGNILGTGSAI